jgi:RHS repeat-associated protein
MYWDYAGPTVIADTSSLTTRRPWYSMVYNDAVQGLALSPYGMTDASRYQVQHLAGQKQYELSNHLGNVQATVSDLPVKVGEAHTEYHAPALPAVYDYYPFGMLMPDRYTSDTSSECVTVSQTKWVTTWVTHCYLAADWVWPAYSYYGSVSVSTSSGLQIAAGESSGIYFEIDVLPYEQQDVYLQTDAFYSGSGTLELQEYHGGQWHMLGSTTFDKLGEVRISIRPREDRIRAVLRGPFYVQLKQFCVQRPQLSQETVLVDICDTDGDKYRFGFNGQEKVNEWAGIANHLDFGARGYDSRIGRWYSVDQVKKSDLSAYQFGRNSPIAFVDPDGNTEYYFNGKWVGSDKKDNGMIAIVKTKSVRDQIKKNTFSFPEPEKMQNGYSTGDMFVIGSNVLKTANNVLKEALSEKGKNREFGTVMHRDPEQPDGYRPAIEGIIEGPEFDLDAAARMSVDLPSGAISIHSHATGVGQMAGGNMNADDPSGGDKANMDTEDMTIIVGKKSETGVVQVVEEKDFHGKPLDYPKKSYKDYRDKKGTIEVYNKDNKTQSLQSISGQEAQSILEDYSGRK